MLDRADQRRRALRCAIYTRKSSEEGLEQDFNSLHAQREACAAYIASQRHEGWSLVPTAFDDGGFSGGTMERPALKSLLADIEASKIDIVVVYKVDRLTRSLADFAKIVERFDAKGVSFVSVTQSFNTTSSMGRLTLNVLLSFAQFEREVTGERIRDKIAASKKKGLWMGGYVPMGYVADGRTLTIHEEDAAIIRMIFDRFIVLRSIRRLKQELDRKGVITRSYRSKSGRLSGGRGFSLGHLRRILTARLYVGEITHKGETHPGQHPPIIARETFDAVAAILADGKYERHVGSNAKHANLLAGLLVNAAGQSLIGSHAIKNGRRYRYYIEKGEARQSGQDSSVGAPLPKPRRLLRIPASELEPLIVQSIVTHFNDHSWLAEMLSQPDLTPTELLDNIAKAAQLVQNLQGHDPVNQRAAMHRIVAGIIVTTDRVEIAVRTDCLVDDADRRQGDKRGSNELPAAKQADVREAAVRITIETRLEPRGRHLALIIASADKPAAARLDKPLIKALARGITWYDDLASGRVASMQAIAIEEGVSERYVSRLIRFAFLAPDLVEQCLNGEPNLPITGADITANPLLPASWVMQRAITTKGSSPTRLSPSPHLIEYSTGG